MKKTIIAAAVAAVAAAPAAFADVSIYGKAHVALTNVNEAAGSDNAASRLGFNFSEDLGNGLKASGNIEYGVEMGDDTASTMRTNSVGISGDFGSVKWGRQYNPTKRMTTAVDFAADTAIDVSVLLDTANNIAELTTNNSIEYVGSFNGVTVRAMTAVDGVGEDDFSIAYSANGLMVGYATNSAETDVLAATYTMGDVTVGASQTENAAGTKLTAITGKYKMGANTIIAQYGDDDTDDGWGVAVSHAMSKNTSVYVGARDSEAVATADTDTALALGMVVNF
jgi:predicted porin